MFKRFWRWLNRREEVGSVATLVERDEPISIGCYITSGDIDPAAPDSVPLCEPPAMPREGQVVVFHDTRGVRAVGVVGKRIESPGYPKVQRYGPSDE